MNIYEASMDEALAYLEPMDQEALVQQVMTMRAHMRITERAMQGFAAQVYDLIYSAMHTSDQENKDRHLNAAMAALKPMAEQGGQ